MKERESEKELSYYCFLAPPPPRSQCPPPLQSHIVSIFAFFTFFYFF